MTDPTTAAQEPSSARQFDALVEAFAGRPGVTAPGEQGRRRGFGSSALKVNGSIFAMLVNEHVVVKLPGRRVEELLGSGAGEPFSGGRGTPMREWVIVTSTDDRIRLDLVEEAFSFVRDKT